MEGAGPAGRPRRPTVVVGLGNEHRADDGAGILVARQLRPRLESRVRVVEGPADATALLDLWDARTLAIVIDAVRSGAPVGSVRRIEVGAGPLAALAGSTSTHGFSLGEAVELGRALGQFPERLIVYGIEAGRFDAGDAVSPEVRTAVGLVVERIASELRDAGAA